MPGKEAKRESIRYHTELFKFFFASFFLVSGGVGGLLVSGKVIQTRLHQVLAISGQF